MRAPRPLAVQPTSRGGSISRGHERRTALGVGQFLVATEGQLRMAKDTHRRPVAPERLVAVLRRSKTRLAREAGKPVGGTTPAVLPARTSAYRRSRPHRLRSRHGAADRLPLLRTPSWAVVPRRTRPGRRHRRAAEGRRHDSFRSPPRTYLAYNAPGPTGRAGFTVPVPKTASYRPRDAREREILQVACDGLTASPPKSVIIRVDGDKIALVAADE